MNGRGPKKRTYEPIPRSQTEFTNIFSKVASSFLKKEDKKHSSAVLIIAYQRVDTEHSVTGGKLACCIFIFSPFFLQITIMSIITKNIEILIIQFLYFPITHVTDYID